MSEIESPAETPPSESAPAAPASAPPPADPVLGDAGKRALDAMKAERNAAKKEAAGLAARVKDFEDRDKSESEKAAEALQAAEGRAAAAERELLRMKVASELGVPADLHEFLTGDTEDELRAKAAKLAAMGTGPRRPLPDPSQGARPDTPSASLDHQIEEATKRRDFATVIALKRQRAAQQT